MLSKTVQIINEGTFKWTKTAREKVPDAERGAFNHSELIREGAEIEENEMEKVSLLESGHSVPG